MRGAAALMAPERTLLLIGGGRWARVYLSLLSRLALPITKIAIISKHGGDSIDAALSEANTHCTIPLVRAATLDDGLTLANVSGAIVVNTARAHVRTALTLIDRKIPVLLEKPVALTLPEAEQLVYASTANKTVLMPGLVLDFCDYLYEFAQAARDTLEAVQSIEIRWSDPVGELRYGEAKSFDASISAVEEIAPHVATLLSIVAGGSDHSVHEATFARGGLLVALTGQWNDIPLAVSLERQAVKRERIVILRDVRGKQVELDFSIEPGTIKTGSNSRSGSANWSQQPRPLSQQLSKFIDIMHGSPRQSDIEAIRTTTAFTVRAAQLVRESQRRWLCSRHRREHDTADCLVAMRELLAPELVDTGLVPAGDNDRLTMLAHEAMELNAGIRRLDATPNLEQILRQVGILTGTEDLTTRL